MKTFTLRLTDNEAEALSRMSACYGMSKNKLLTMLIADEYENLMFFEPQPDPTKNTAFLYMFESMADFPRIMMEHFYDLTSNGKEFSISGGQCVTRILSAYDYVLETETDPNKLAEVEKEKEQYIERTFLEDLF